MTVNRPRDAKFRSVSLSQRRVEALDAGLEVVSAPWALWLRLCFALVLGTGFLAFGLFVFAGLAGSTVDGTFNDYGGPLWPAVGGLVCLALGAIVVRGGWSTFKAFRSRSLL